MYSIQLKPWQLTRITHIAMKDYPTTPIEVHAGLAKLGVLLEWEAGVSTM